MRHTRIHCIRVFAYMHTRIRVYAYWADAYYAYILVRIYLSCTVFALVPEIFKFEKWVKYANEMTDDVIHSTQYYIEYINRAILAILQSGTLKLGRLLVLQKTHP